ncbi:MAG: hypothetical protein ABI700_10225 [Chloroflexota bacterium]
MRYPLSLRLLVGALICLFAWAAFTVGLDSRGIYQDERYSWDLGQLSAFELVRETANDVHPPVFYLWLDAWMRTIGSEKLFVIRLTATIPALLAVAVCFRLALRLFNNLWSAAGAAAYSSTMPAIYACMR